jgi:hypothetical protein
MSHPNELTRQYGDVTVKVKAFTTNLLFYKSIGCTVTAWSQQRKRSWRCLWLCSSPVPVKLQSVVLRNTYYSEVEGSAFLIQKASHEARYDNVSECTLKHSAAGFGAKLKFSVDGTTSGHIPAGVPDLLPLDGVLSHVSTFGQQGDTFSVAIGPHPG